MNNIYILNLPTTFNLVKLYTIYTHIYKKMTIKKRVPTINECIRNGLIIKLTTNERKLLLLTEQSGHETNLTQTNASKL